MKQTSRIREWKNETLSPGQNIFRWTVAVITPLVLILFIILLNPQKREIKKIIPPEIQLSYVVLEEQKPKVIEKPKEAPKPKPKKVIKKVTKVVKKEPKIEKPKEEPKEPIEEKVVEKKPEEPVEEKVAEEPEEGVGTADDGVTETVAITGSAQLDNTNFDPIFMKKPKYPIIALRNNIEGNVTITLYISDKGKVESSKILSYKGHPSFKKELLKVVDSWRFPPPRVNGKAVNVEYTYIFQYRLN